MLSISVGMTCCQEPFLLRLWRMTFRSNSTRPYVDRIGTSKVLNADRPACGSRDPGAIEPLE
jgi:hypothetical protein